MGRFALNDSAEVKVLPPVVLATAVGLEFLVAIFAPMLIVPNAPAIVFGGAVVAVAVALVIQAARQLVREGTAFDARKSTTSIVTTGVYQFTRNPVYLSMMLLVVGIALILNSLWALLEVIPTGSALYLPAIRPEERYLERKFDGAYQSYRDAVPRWLSLPRLIKFLRARRGT